MHFSYGCVDSLACQIVIMLDHPQQVNATNLGDQAFGQTIDAFSMLVQFMFLMLEMVCLFILFSCSFEVSCEMVHAPYWDLNSSHALSILPLCMSYPYLLYMDGQEVRDEGFIDEVVRVVEGDAWYLLYCTGNLTPFLCRLEVTIISLIYCLCTVTMCSSL